MDGLPIPPIINFVGLIVGLSVIWWRVAVLEREVLRLREDRHTMANQITRMEGKMDVLLSMLSRAFGERLGDKS